MEDITQKLYIISNTFSMKIFIGLLRPLKDYPLRLACPLRKGRTRCHRRAADCCRLNGVSWYSSDTGVGLLSCRRRLLCARLETIGIWNERACSKRKRRMSRLIGAHIRSLPIWATVTYFHMSQIQTYKHYCLVYETLARSKFESNFRFPPCLLILTECVPLK